MRSRIWIIVMLLVVAACAEGTLETTTTGLAGPAPSTTAPPPAATTTSPAATIPATTMSAASTGLDLSDQAWVVHTVDGITDASGELLFATDPLLGEENLVRDRDGGIIFSDAFGLWWWPAGETEPDLVLQGSFFRLVEAIPTVDGPVVRIADVGDRYVSLAELAEVAPIDGTVEITADFALIRHAANGLAATVTPPDVTLDFEGFPDEVIEPAHLVITHAGEAVLDLRVGGPVEAYARIHDFDGRHVILSRGPYEPALPPETFWVIDLACAECTRTFIEGAATAALTGPDSDWNGPVSAPEEICSSWDPGFAGTPDVGLPNAVEAARANLLRATAACDITGLQYELDVDATIVLSHATINRYQPTTWLEVSPNLLGEIDAALRQPGRTDRRGDEVAHVFPAWFAVDGWVDLTSSEQAAMQAWYGDGAPEFWTDYFGIARPDDIAVTISDSGTVIALTRPLS